MKNKKALIKSANLYEGNTIRVVFPYDLGMVKAIRTIKHRIWNDKKKHWLIPLTLHNCLLLKKWDFILDTGLKTWGNLAWKRKNQPFVTNTKIKGLNGTLFPYQGTGVVHIERQNGRALIADEMGLGKTIEALAWCQLYYNQKPRVVLCPASLKWTWEEEVQKWMPSHKIQVIEGRKTNTFEDDADTYIINYSIIKDWYKVLRTVNPKVLIMDEVHYIKNNRVKRTSATKFFCKAFPYIIGLTGTPIENSPADLYNIVSILDKNLLPEKQDFKFRYCGPKHNGYGWEFKGATNTEELHEVLINSVMIRRKKSEVMKELPPKLYSAVPLRISNKSEYKKAERLFIKYMQGRAIEDIEENLEGLAEKTQNIVNINEEALKELMDEIADKANPMTRMEILKQLAVKGIMDSLIEWVINFLESGEKLLLFATHKFVVNQLYERFGKIAVKIDGSTPTKKRQQIVNQFQTNKKIKLFIGNIQAAGVGLTLTAASYVGIIEYPWVPAKLFQAIDRAHRIGQKKMVNVTYFFGKDTIIERIVKQLDRKSQMSSSIIDGEVLKGEDLISNILKSYKKQADA